ncbi:uncharacterized protein LY89DRAFT_732058 [Mollisia scopiformis]|uniref:Uncharacterized protein n=1 Tax=Mollisia scopiformis TaxID=149040 RepID=A0A194XEC8_MOLSC|nr:uncharacterized protein LY89DRAFT_732058 [Mollisia scopiformis]KUJ18499.1 hypothetical protein LY89DRAFT_732058 [Mollisia scopiformis]
MEQRILHEERSVSDDTLCPDACNCPQHRMNNSAQGRYEDFHEAYFHTERAIDNLRNQWDDLENALFTERTRVSRQDDELEMLRDENFNIRRELEEQQIIAAMQDDELDALRDENFNIRRELEEQQFIAAMQDEETETLTSENVNAYQALEDDRNLIDREMENVATLGGTLGRLVADRDNRIAALEETNRVLLTRIEHHEQLNSRYINIVRELCEQLNEQLRRIQGLSAV